MEKGGDDSPLRAVLKNTELTLSALADTVLLYQPVVRRKKLEQMITELVHQRDVTREVRAAENLLFINLHVEFLPSSCSCAYVIVFVHPNV